MYNMKKSLVSLAAGISLLTMPLGASSGMSPQRQEASATLVGWREYHAVAGNCSLYLPKDPEHLSEKIVMPDDGFELKYDAYISAADQQAVFMLLVAQYPEFVDQAYARMSLEGFLHGVITHNPENQLLFSDLVLVEGHEALDFFIRTGNVYFKGRAVMVKNSLYLIAMECEIPHYDEVRYNQFVESFRLSQGI